MVSLEDFLVYFLWIFKVMGSRLSYPARHVYYAVCHFLLSGITETQNSFFIIENTEVIEDSFFVFLRHRVLLETGLINNGPLRSIDNFIIAHYCLFLNRVPIKLCVSGNPINPALCSLSLKF